MRIERHLECERYRNGVLHVTDSDSDYCTDVVINYAQLTKSSWTRACFCPLHDVPKPTACLQYCTVEQYGQSHVLIHIFFSLNISQESVSRRTSILCVSVTIAIAAYILVNCYFIKTVSDGRGRRTIVRHSSYHRYWQYVHNYRYSPQTIEGCIVIFDIRLHWVVLGVWTVVDSE